MIALLGHMESIILLIALDWRLRPHLQAMSIITELEYCLDNLLLSLKKKKKTLYYNKMFHLHLKQIIKLSVSRKEPFFF